MLIVGGPDVQLYEAIVFQKEKKEGSDTYANVKMLWFEWSFSPLKISN